MIPIILLDALVDRFKEEFWDFKIIDPKNPEIYKGLNIFPQHLPARGKSEGADHYPCLIIRLSEGEEPTEDDPQKVKVLFIAGVFDRNVDNQGYRDAFTIVQRIYASLKRNPVLNDQYELSFPIKWAYHDEDAEPYFFAGIETTWEVPKHIREDVEHLT